MNKKICHKCLKEQDISEYYPAKRTADKLNTWCKSCYREYSKNRKLRFDAKIKYKKWLESIGGNEGFYKRYKSSISKAEKKYRTSPKGRASHCAAQLRRKAYKLGLREHFTTSEWNLIREYYSPNNVCPSCKQVAIMQIEHIVPLFKQGTDDIRNIQPLCEKCNHNKYLKTIDYRFDGGTYAKLVYAYSDAT